MLLHSVPLAEGWLAYLTAIRQKLGIKGSIREMVIIRVALITGAKYEAQQHTPIAVEEGMSLDQVMALSNWENSELFDDDEKAVLALTDEMTQSTTVELIATIAAYNMVSRVIEALEISVEDAREL